MKIFIKPSGPTDRFPLPHLYLGLETGKKIDFEPYIGMIDRQPFIFTNLRDAVLYIKSQGDTPCVLPEHFANVPRKFYAYFSRRNN